MTLSSLVLWISAGACAAPAATDVDSTTPSMSPVVPPWACAAELPGVREPELLPLELAELMAALDDDSSERVEQAAERLMQAAMRAVEDDFRQLDEERAGTGHRSFLDTWVHGPIPILSIGVERFWLAGELAEVLASRALREDRMADARRWLLQSGRPATLDERRLTCLLWIDLAHEPHRVAEYEAALDWQSPALVRWRPLVDEALESGGPNGDPEGLR
ncbi:MAG: hypothetical protein EA398_04365 [Deltaproteobacteria bacterium]|nr:MAG: hypothetical protein EA398_04365 [Deltaproteobacteria bacterium]